MAIVDSVTCRGVSIAVLVALAAVAVGACADGDAPAVPARQFYLAGDAAPRGCTTGDHAPVSTDPRVVALARAAGAFHRSLGPLQRHNASFCLEDPELTSWTYLPSFIAVRRGIKLGELSPAQLEAAYAMLDAFLSDRGYGRLDHIVNTLDELNRQKWLGFGYGADLYRLSIFNQPGSDGSWGVQIDGHHLAITFVVDGDHVYMTPAFFGGQPNVLDGVRMFGDEETLASAFLDGLSTAQLQKALVAPVAPKDIVTAPGTGGPDRSKDFDYAQLVGVGLGATELDGDQRVRLRALIAQVMSYQDDPFAAARMADIDAALDASYFVWMGPTDGSARYYFRIYNPRVLIEYDLSTVIGEDLDHTHLVIRSPDQGDYGPFALRSASLQGHLRGVRHGLARGGVARSRPGGAQGRVAARLGALAATPM